MTKISFEQKLKCTKKRNQNERRNMRKWELIRDEYCPQCDKKNVCTLKSNGWWLCNKMTLRRKAEQVQNSVIKKR